MKSVFAFVTMALVFAGTQAYASCCTVENDMDQDYTFRGEPIDFWAPQPTLADIPCKVETDACLYDAASRVLDLYQLQYALEAKVLDSWGFYHDLALIDPKAPNKFELVSDPKLASVSD